MEAKNQEIGHLDEEAKALDMAGQRQEVRVKHIETEAKHFETIIGSLVEKLAKIRTTFDLLLISLITLSLFAHLNKDKGQDSVIEIPVLKINVPYGDDFLIIMSLIILGNFAMVGSNLIDYFAKRALLEVSLSRHFKEFNSKYTNIRKNAASIFVHNSFCEYLYRFGSLWPAKLYFPASAVMWLMFIYSQYVIVLLLGSAYGSGTLRFWLAIFIACIPVVPLYLTFFWSIMRAKKLVLEEEALNAEVTMEEPELKKKRRRLRRIYAFGFFLPLAIFVAAVQFGDWLIKSVIDLLLSAGLH
jgi:hypothetical protein